MKGGYKIIDFKNASLSGTPVTMTDVLVDLLNNYDKVVLLSNVVLSGSAKDDCFSTVLSDGDGGVKLNCYDGFISINSSGAVTYTVASTSGMARDIADLQSDVETLNELFKYETFTAKYYDNETYLGDVSGECWSVGNIYIMYIYDNSFDYDVSTMLQIRELPCNKIITGTVQSSMLTNQGGNITLQPMPDGRAFYRPNITGNLEGTIAFCLIGIKTT